MFHRVEHPKVLKVVHQFAAGFLRNAYLFQNYKKAVESGLYLHLVYLKSLASSHHSLK